MIHLVTDDTVKVSTVANNLRGPIQQHLLLQVPPHHTWPVAHQMVGNFFAYSYAHLPGQTIGNIDQNINYITKVGRQSKQRQRKERQRKGCNNYNNYYNYNSSYHNSYHSNQQQPQLNEKKKQRKRPHQGLRLQQQQGQEQLEGRQEHQGSGKSTSTTSTSTCWICGKVGHRAPSCWFNNKKRQQHPAATTTSTTSAFSATRRIRSTDLAHASRRRHYTQLPATAARATTADAISETWTSPTLDHISIIYHQVVHTKTDHLQHQCHRNNKEICEGGQPPDFGNNRHLFNINQLNREHLQDLPRGLLRHWEISCDTGAVTSVAPPNFADHVPLQPHYTELSLPTATNQPIHIYGYKGILLVCNPSGSQHGSTYAKSRPRCWGYTTSLTTKRSYILTARTVLLLNIKAKQNFCSIIAVIFSLTLWLLTPTTALIIIGSTTYSISASTAINASSWLTSTTPSEKWKDFRHSGHQCYLRKLASMLILTVCKLGAL